MSDQEYQTFLYQCYSEQFELGNDANSEDNDPAYVYNDDIFSHGWKFNLDEELLHAGEKEEDERGERKGDGSVPSVPDDKSAIASVSAVPNVKCPHNYFDNPEFKRVLNQQLRQNIQLLTQTYLMATCMTNMQSEVDETRSHLDSYMKMFKNRSKPSNLLPAMKLVNDCVAPKELRSSVRLSWRHLPVPDMAKDMIKQHPNVFPYAKLLPQVAFSLLPKRLLSKKPKIIFTPNEDKLLALALNEFENEHAQYAYIASLLMAAKTKMQINNHVKNMKRSPGNEENPIMIYISQGRLPEVNLDSDSELREPSSSPITTEPIATDLDALMAASTTISKNNGISEKNIRNLKLKKSMLTLMSHKFSLSQEMGQLMVQDFLKMSREKLEERHYVQLLQLMTELARRNRAVETFFEISRFLKRINAPRVLSERLILFLDLEQATKCGYALDYLHWMRFFHFINHVEVYHNNDGLDKKLGRLIDAIQKEDSHKIRLATANLVNKHPLLKSEFEALSLEGKPHPSLFINKEDFDDITEPFALYDSSKTHDSILDFEHFDQKPTRDEINFSSQACPCRCHKDSGDIVNGQHCNKCNLKFMKGRMYIVNKIKPLLAEWSYVDAGHIAPASSPPLPVPLVQPAAPAPPPPPPEELQWTFEEDKEILEFCRAKALMNTDSVSFDTTTFEELVSKRRLANSHDNSSKKGPRQIADRFNHLMEMYREKVPLT